MVPRTGRTLPVQLCLERYGRFWAWTVSRRGEVTGIGRESVVTPKSVDAASSVSPSPGVLTAELLFHGCGNLCT